MDDIVFDLFHGKALETREEGQLLSLLNWNRSDRMICVRLENQQQSLGTTLAHALHSDLFQIFPDAYIMLSDNQQCVLMNVSRDRTTLPMLRHRVAPLCRDYCLYAGISSPVNGLGELHTAYEQAGIALNEAFRLHSERWVIPFPDCALEYIMEQIQSSMRLSQLAAPELYTLLEHDRVHGENEG